jgi:hypothetical protein
MAGGERPYLSDGSIVSILRTDECEDPDLRCRHYLTVAALRAADGRDLVVRQGGLVLGSGAVVPGRGLLAQACGECGEVAAVRLSWCGDRDFYGG